MPTRDGDQLSAQMSGQPKLFTHKLRLSAEFKANYTDLAPVLQISDVVVGRS